MPVTLVDDGGLPVTNTELGTPMTPTDGVTTNLPLAVPVTLVESGGLPVALVNDDLSPWEPGEE